MKRSNSSAPRRRGYGKLDLFRWLDEIGMSDLGQGEKNICRVLLRWIDSEGVCWPAVGTVAKHAGMSDRGAQRIIRRLEAKGVLVYPSGRSSGGQRDNGAGRTNVMQLRLDRIKATHPDLRSGLSGHPAATREAGDARAEPRPAIPATPTRDPDYSEP